jgi:hypothetical protein
MPSRYFTLEEANGLIPRLEMLMERLQRAVREIQSVALAGDPRRHMPTADEIRRAHPELAPAVEGIEYVMTEIEELGCQFKGFDLGLVDFPGEIAGRSVLWCWQYGEKFIGFWHAIDEGFAGRHPIASAAAPPLQ